MSERASVIQKVQVANEGASPGTAATTGFKELKSVSFEPGIQMTRTAFRAQGYRHASLVPPGKEWTTASVRGPVTYGEIIYPLSMIFGTATAASFGTTSGSAYRWVWTPSNSGVVTPLSYTVEQGDGTNQAQRMTYGYMSEIGFTFNRDMIDMSGQMTAQRLTAFSGTLTPSPGTVELVPVLPEDIDVYINSSYSNFAANQVDRVLSAEFRVSNFHNVVWTLDSRNSSWAACVNTAPTVECRIMMEADSNGMGYLTNARQGDRRYIRINALGAAAGTGFYTFNLDMAGEISAVAPFRDDQGVYAVEWTFTSVYEPSWSTGKTYEISVVNKTASL